ncbi:MAG: feruloyl-CoA synthase [Acidobacteriota bacterium]
MATSRVRAVPLGPLSATLDRRADGTMLLRSRGELGGYPRRATERLAYWAGVAADRPMLAWRGAAGRFETLTYGDGFSAVQRLGAALIGRGLSADRPVAILSGNDREHALLVLAAQHVGIPVCPISPAYSSAPGDFVMLKHAMRLLTPGLVFAGNSGRVEAALAAAVPLDVEVVTGGGSAAAPHGAAGRRRRDTTFDELLSAEPTAAVAGAHARITPETIAKILLTSGSTALPKGVINTHRMLCSNQQMIAYVMPFLCDEPPILVDWLPWHHTFGGNHNLGLVLHHGGTLYIDEGRPLPALFPPTIRNLREIAPTVYLNVPRGYEELVKAMRQDDRLRVNFFSRLRLLFYAAAALSQHVLDALDALALETCGERLFMMTGLGATETAPMAICRTWESPLAGAIGVPVPQVEAKLVPTGGKLEIRVRGPNVTPGYWRREDLTRAAFDEEGFYRIGDAVRFVDPGDISRGLAFDGRLAEDFKLATGTWVNVGVLRARAVVHFAPYLRDFVVTGHDRNEIGVLAVPDVDACRALCPALPASAAGAEVLAQAAVRDWVCERLTSFAAASTGTSTRVTRAMILDEPPLLDALEVTDKGSLNQRAMLTRRAALVEELYAAVPSPRVVTIAGAAAEAG